MISKSVFYLKTFQTDSPLNICMPNKHDKLTALALTLKLILFCTLARINLKMKLKMFS